MSPAFLLTRGFLDENFVEDLHQFVGDDLAGGGEAVADGADAPSLFLVEVHIGTQPFDGAAVTGDRLAGYPGAGFVLAEAESVVPLDTGGLVAHNRAGLHQARALFGDDADAIQLTVTHMHHHVARERHDIGFHSAAGHELVGVFHEPIAFTAVFHPFVGSGHPLEMFEILVVLPERDESGAVQVGRVPAGVEPQRLEDPLVAEPVEPLARSRLYDAGYQIVTEIAVLEMRARFVIHVVRIPLVVARRVKRGEREDIIHIADGRGVVQEHPHRDGVVRILRVADRDGQVFLDIVIQVDLAVVHQAHHGCSSVGFGNGGQAANLVVPPTEPGSQRVERAEFPDIDNPVVLDHRAHHADGAVPLEEGAHLLFQGRGSFVFLGQQRTRSGEGQNDGERKDEELFHRRTISFVFLQK